MILELIDPQPKTICDRCDESQGPFYYYKDDRHITTFVYCEECAEEVADDEGVTLIYE